jgi:hypothetical protein
MLELRTRAAVPLLALLHGSICQCATVLIAYHSAILVGPSLNWTTLMRKPGGTGSSGA